MKPKPVPPAGVVLFTMRIVPVVGAGGGVPIWTLKVWAAAGVSIAGAISADVETATAARAVKSVRFIMTCLLVTVGGLRAASVRVITVSGGRACP